MVYAYNVTQWLLFFICTALSDGCGNLVMCQ